MGKHKIRTYVSPRGVRFTAIDWDGSELKLSQIKKSVPVAFQIEVLTEIDALIRTKWDGNPGDLRLFNVASAQTHIVHKGDLIVTDGKRIFPMSVHAWDSLFDHWRIPSNAIDIELDDYTIENFEGYTLYLNSDNSIACIETVDGQEVPKSMHGVIRELIESYTSFPDYSELAAQRERETQEDYYEAV